MVVLVFLNTFSNSSCDNSIACIFGNTNGPNNDIVLQTEPFGLICR